MRFTDQYVTPESFNQAVGAVLGEIQYQNTLPRRTHEEAKDIAGFFTLLDVYVRRGQDAWAGLPTDDPGNPGEADEVARHVFRKIAAIAIRAMMVNGIRERP